MSRRKKRRNRSGGGSQRRANDRSGESDSSGPDDIKVGPSQERKSKPRWREFPGPGKTDEAYRIAFDPDAYADVVAYAREDLNVEICGVLVGEVCRDDDGEFLLVAAAVRGTAAKSSGAHVTFTQETWNRIHETLEQEHPDLRIVGWYHSHPGFGVEFSDMDRFIQENFFSGPGQTALVIDPLGGQEALWYNGPDGIEHARRIWVGGREKRCFVPKGESGAVDSSSSDIKKCLESVESRLSQALQAIDDLRTSMFRFLQFMGFIVATGVVVWIVMMIWARFTADTTPPEKRAYLNAPLKIDGQWYWVGSMLTVIKLPPEQQAQRAEEERKLLEATTRKSRQDDSQKKGGSKAQPPATGPGPDKGDKDKTTGSSGGGGPAAGE